MHAAELALAGSARIDGDVVIACCGLAGSGVRAALAVEAGQGAWVPAESPELLGRLDPVFRARDGSLPGVAVHAPEAGGVAVVALNVAPKPGQEGMLAVRVMRMLESQVSWRNVTLTYRCHARSPRGFREAAAAS